MNRLRIAFLLDDSRVPSWVAAIAADAVASGTCDVVAAVVSRSNNDHRPSPYRPQLNPFRLSRFYIYLDYLVCRPSLDALAPVEFTKQLKPGSIVETDPIITGPYFRFNEADQQRIRQLDLDVLLLFWSALPDQEAASLARYGVWFLRDHQRELAGDAPTPFWEVLDHQPVTMQCLHAQLSSSHDLLTLSTSCLPTLSRSIALARNNLLWKSASLMSRKLNQLQESRSLAGLSLDDASCVSAVPQEKPSNVTMAKRIASQVSRFVRDRGSALRYFDQWVIAYKYTSIETGSERNLADYQWLIPPKDRDWADPFPVETANVDFLFFEEVLYSERKGHLSVAEIDETGLQEEPQRILKCPYHLSYPFVFQWDGEWYLIPETHEASRIDVYRFSRFPYELSYFKTLMENIDACDATLFEANGRWWMFAAVASRGTWNVDELFLFHSDTPFGTWRPHPKNPVKSDVRSARPAGRIFRRDGRCYRPAQDCSQRYGYAVRVHEITVLSEVDYQELEVNAILPDASVDLVGIHTLNVGDTLSVIDAKKRRRR